MIIENNSNILFGIVRIKRDFLKSDTTHVHCRNISISIYIYIYIWTTLVCVVFQTFIANQYPAWILARISTTGQADIGSGRRRISTVRRDFCSKVLRTSPASHQVSEFHSFCNSYASCACLCRVFGGTRRLRMIFLP